MHSKYKLIQFRIYHFSWSNFLVICITSDGRLLSITDDIRFFEVLHFFVVLMALSLTLRIIILKFSVDNFEVTFYFMKFGFLVRENKQLSTKNASEP